MKNLKLYSLLFFIIILLVNNEKTFPQINKNRSIANYQIEVKLDPKRKTIEGTEIVTFVNNTRDNIDEIQFHLYHNAYKSGKSTYCTEGKIEIDPNDNGYTELLFLKILNSDVTNPVYNFIQPDDGNPYDQTVMRIKLPKPIRPYSVMRFNIGFITKLPPGGIGRSGYARGKDFFFVSQWFPKLGVYEEGKGWNCHQFHRLSEFYADFGIYEVKITTPKNYLIGSTGVRESKEEKGNLVTYTYRQENIHDFAWVASSDIVEIHETFKHPSLPATEMIFFMQKEHLDQLDRHRNALKMALKFMGEWIAPYPYKSITVIDPPMTSSSTGMEYPMLITCGTNYFVPKDDFSLEGLVIHEFCHQYWYGLVANNEFEEAWLDEGFTTYSTAKIMEANGLKNISYFRIGGGIPLNGYPLITYDNFPLLFFMDQIELPFFSRSKISYLQNPDADKINKFSWQYFDRNNYRINAYNKPCLVLKTLENILGRETMNKILKEYFESYKYSHPKTNDFIKIVEKISKRNMDWFFSQTVFSSDILDYEVTDITNTKGENKNRIDLILTRKGGIKFPVEVKILLQDSTVINDTWDGNEKWIKKTYYTDYPALYAKIDPNDKLVLDINISNNSKITAFEYSPIIKWTQQWLFWMQNFLFIISTIC